MCHTRKIVIITIIIATIIITITSLKTGRSCILVLPAAVTGSKIVRKGNISSKITLTDFAGLLLSRCHRAK